jgi:alkanesulfonate monooxygenase SsuD/methylene tetrahydromethanopterin reductase-like flavin-dependent oxidoreductase (luciferase family)
MKFGIFDHVDRSHLTLADQFDKRLAYVAKADELGFHCYHVAEHHATPLNMVPVPGVYLGAVARATKRMRLGPLTYLLTLYSPLRLIEEIAMLDHLSHGRLDLGVGRGVSPFELNYHNVDPATSREVYQDALDAVLYGLTHDRLDHDGKHFKYKSVPMELRPLQQPHPPIWYPSSNADSAGYSGAKGYNFVTLGSLDGAKKCVDAYRDGFAKRGNKPFGPAQDFPEGVAIGISRHIVVADTDEKAKTIAKPAHEHWHANLTKLWRENKVEGPGFARSTESSVDAAYQNGSFIAGAPETVRATIQKQMDVLGINYMVCAFYFGNMAHEDAMRSIQLFANEVMPKVKTQRIAA